MTTIYIRLMDESVDVWRPVSARQVGGEIYIIDANAALPRGEAWEFTPGPRVRCQWRTFAEGEGFAAVELAGESAAGPRS